MILHAQVQSYSIHNKVKLPLARSNIKNKVAHMLLPDRKNKKKKDFLPEIKTHWGMKLEDIFLVFGVLGLSS